VGNTIHGTQTCSSAVSIRPYRSTNTSSRSLTITSVRLAKDPSGSQAILGRNQAPTEPERRRRRGSSHHLQACLVDTRTCYNSFMRLATWNWNSQAGSGAHWDALEALDVDVVTLQECGSAIRDQARAREHSWTCEWQVGREWKSERHRKGLAVLARAPYTVGTPERSEPCAISAIISGPAGFPFRFVGFWAMSPTDSGEDEYPQQATELIQSLPDDDIPTVVAGDFNASSRNEHHLRNVASLADLGMISAYHSSRGMEKHTEDWPDPTSYHIWDRSRPHHMDYVFVPDWWQIETVTVGTFDDYPTRHLSDHVPIVVMVDPRNER
jgi:endonuclease/exonuclease/phosphatase family metal-dependent hydrolase